MRQDEHKRADLEIQAFKNTFVQNELVKKTSEEIDKRSIASSPNKVEIVSVKLDSNYNSGNSHGKDAQKMSKVN